MCWRADRSDSTTRARACKSCGTRREKCPIISHGSEALSEEIGNVRGPAYPDISSGCCPVPKSLRTHRSRRTSGFSLLTVSKKPARRLLIDAHALLTANIRRHARCSPDTCRTRASTAARLNRATGIRQRRRRVHNSTQSTLLMYHHVLAPLGASSVPKQKSP